MLETLWDGKLILAGFVVAAMALGGVFLTLNKPKYVTEATYEISLAPPSFRRMRYRRTFQGSF